MYVQKKTRGITFMLKEFLWKAFEKTGNIDAYVFYKEMEEKSKALDEGMITREEVAISNL